MIDNAAALAALRARAIGLSVCTTGSAALSATTTGYARSLGSFVADGFVIGEEVTPSGFSLNTATGLVIGVSALALTIKGGCTTEAETAGRTLAVGLPALRAWENVALEPSGDRWFLEEDYLPGPVEQIPLGAYGTVESLPQYVLRLYGIAGLGSAALAAVADALLTLFAPRQGVTLSSGDWLAVRTSPAPYRSQITQGQPGFAVTTVTIPLRFRSANSI